MNCMADYLVQYGAGLVDILRRFDKPPSRATHESLVLKADDCTGGLHVDVSSKRIDFWLAAPEPDARERACRQWPGWAVEWHHDSFEAHGALTGQKLKFELRPQETLVDEVIKILEHQSQKDHGESTLEIAELLSKREGKNVDVNPAALVDAPHSVPTDLRQRILRDARSSLLER
jgi:hypothetical protein